VLRPRLLATPETRVPTTSPSPRVLRAVERNNLPPPILNPIQTPTTSNDTTAPTNVRLVRPIHQRHTRSNNPFTILDDCTPDDDDEDIADDITIKVSNQHGGAPFSPFIRQMLEPPRHAVCTRPITSPATCTVHDLQPTNKPTDVPTPRVLRSVQQQTIAQPPAGSSQRVLQSALSTATTSTPPSQQLSPHLIPPDNNTRAPPIRQAR